MAQTRMSFILTTAISLTAARLSPKDSFYLLIIGMMACMQDALQGALEDVRRKVTIEQTPAFDHLFPQEMKTSLNSVEAAGILRETSAE